MDAEAMVEAVLDVLAPLADVPPEIVPPEWRIRIPVIWVDWDGQAVRPSQEQLRALAEQIVTAIRTASAG